MMAGTMLTGCGSGDSDGAGKKADAKGSVYYLNFKPEQDAQWQELAKVYTDETGVDVTVVTAASGQYETTLKSEMGKSESPTLFQVNGPVGLASWKDYCYILDHHRCIKNSHLRTLHLRMAIRSQNRICYRVIRNHLQQRAFKQSHSIYGQIQFKQHTNSPQKLISSMPQIKLMFISAIYSFNPFPILNWLTY